MGGASSKRKATASPSASQDDAAVLERIKRMEHRRRSSIINDDVEHLMDRRAEEDAAANQSKRGYRPTMYGQEVPTGLLDEGKAQAANGGVKAGRTGGRSFRVNFSEKVVVYERPLTKQREKHILHYNRQDLMRMQAEADDEMDYEFQIEAVRVNPKTKEINYKIRFDEDSSNTGYGEDEQWLNRQTIYEMGPLSLSDYESKNWDTLLKMNSDLASLLPAQPQATDAMQQRAKRKAELQRRAEEEAAAPPVDV